MKIKYELVIIVDALKSQSEKDEIVKQVSEIIVKGAGKVINSQVWLEKHKFVFPIKKCTEGTYYIINFESEGSSNPEIKTNLRLNEDILRYVIIKTN